jgi:nicotinamidase/pyrazinamidase
LLLDDLRIRRIGTLHIAGLTMEYCVKQTALDALRAGFHVAVLTDAVAGIDAHPGDTARARQEIAQAGAELTTGLLASTRAR